MNVTPKRLRQIIREEISRTINEQEEMTRDQAVQAIIDANPGFSWPWQKQKGPGKTALAQRLGDWSNDAIQTFVNKYGLTIPDEAAAVLWV